MGTGLRVNLLGPVEVVSPDGPVALGGLRQRALLAFLALHANTVVPRSRLVDALWGERPPATAANALQVAVHGLRRLLGPERIETRGQGYLLRLGSGELDLERFEELSAPAAVEDRPASLRSALELWRGPALADIEEAPFAPHERSRLEERRLEVVERRIEAELAAGEHDRLVAELEQLVREHPYRERLRSQLMLALYRAGRQGDALEAYRRARSDLVEALGVEPSPALQELERAILRQDPALVPPARPAWSLPEPPTPLVGRELEVVAVAASLREPGVRIVTLTGPGGTGKTRLALAAAAELGASLADGACFVGLAALREPELVGPEISQAVGVAERPGEPVADVLAEALRERELLLVLDNCERVAAAAPLVASLLAAAPRVQVLATSRTPLHVSGEHEYPVLPLPVPRPGDPLEAASLARNPAVELFAARARAVRPNFRLTDATAPVVAEICRSLDGLPLALELAAARCKVLAPADVLARLENRLELLTSGPRDLPERQQTLRSTIDWSHDLLDDRARALVASLAVFSGGCSLEAAAAVCDGDLDTVAALVDHSLLRREDPLDGGEPRFRMLETVREYARERLADRGDAPAVHRAHAEHFLGLAERAEPELTGPAAGEWLERLELEHDNFRAALAWAGEEPRRHELELRLGVALQYFWRLRGHLSEGRRWLEAAVERRLEAPPALRAKALVAAAVFVDRHGDHAGARRRYEEALELFHRAGDDRRVARTLSELGALSILEEDYPRAIELYDETLPYFRESGDVRALAVTLSNLASVYGLQRDYERAHSLGLEALAIAREHGDRDQQAISLYNLGRNALARADRQEAAAFLGESLEVGVELGYRELLAYCLLGCGELAAAAGEAGTAARLLGAGDALFHLLGVEPGFEERQGRDDALAALREPLGGEELERLLAEGGGLEQAAAIDAAQELVRTVAGH